MRLVPSLAGTPELHQGSARPAGAAAAAPARGRSSAGPGPSRPGCALRKAPFVPGPRGEGLAPRSYSRVCRGFVPSGGPMLRPGGRVPPGRAPAAGRRRRGAPGPAAPLLPAPRALAASCFPGTGVPRASPSPERPRPDGAQSPALGEPVPAAARGINTRGNNHLVVVVVTQTLGKVQVGGVSGKRAARRSRVKSYIHAGALVQEVHLERRPGGLIDPPSGAFPGAGARANRRGSGAAGRRAFPGSGDEGGPGGGEGQRGKRWRKSAGKQGGDERRGEVGGGAQVGARPPRREEGRVGGRAGAREGGLLFFKSSVPSHGLCLRIQEQLLYTKEPRARRGRTDRAPQPCPTKAGRGGGTVTAARPRGRGERARRCHTAPRLPARGRLPRSWCNRAKCRKSRRRAGSAPREERPGPRPSPPRPPPARCRPRWPGRELVLAMGVLLPGGFQVSNLQRSFGFGHAL